MAITPEVFVERTNTFIDKVQEYLTKTDTLITSIAEMMNYNRLQSDKQEKREKEHEKVEKKKVSIEKEQLNFLKAEDPQKEVNKNLVDIKDILKRPDKKEKPSGSMFDFMKGVDPKWLLGALGIGGLAAIFAPEIVKLLKLEWDKLFNKGPLKPIKDLGNKIIPPIVNTAKELQIPEVIKGVPLGVKEQFIPNFNEAPPPEMYDKPKNIFDAIIKGFIPAKKRAVQTDIGSIRKVGINKNVEKWRPLAEKYANKYGIPVEMAMALISVESGGDPQAFGPFIKEPSSENFGDRAEGLGQIMPKTADWLAPQMGLGERSKGLGMPGFELSNPETNINMAMFYLDKLAGQSGIKDRGKALQWALSRYLGKGKTDLGTKITNADYVSKINSEMGVPSVSPLIPKSKSKPSLSMPKWAGANESDSALISEIENQLSGVGTSTKAAGNKAKDVAVEFAEIWNKSFTDPNNPQKTLSNDIKQLPKGIASELKILFDDLKKSFSNSRSPQVVTQTRASD